MDDYNYKRSGQIPTFGDWDYANEMPITQYFECARQAGLIRYSSSSGESDLYAVDHYNKHSHTFVPPKKTRVREKRGPHVKEQRKQGKVCDVTEPPSNHKFGSRTNHNGVVLGSRPTFHVRNPKPVDEDLYKIPPELLRSSKRKKLAGLLSCFVPRCAS